MIVNISCDRCRDKVPSETLFWNEDHCSMSEDYILPHEYEAVCYDCFHKLIKDGLARWKTEVELANRF